MKLGDDSVRSKFTQPVVCVDCGKRIPEFGDSPNTFGLSLRCRDCNATRQKVEAEQREALEGQALAERAQARKERESCLAEGGDSQIGVPRRFWGVTFDSVQVDGFNRQVIERLRSWAEEPEGFVTLTGGVGRGKTFLCAAVVHHVWMEGQTSVRFITAADLQTELFAALRGDRVDGLVRRYANVGLLALDDLYAVPERSSWASETLQYVLMKRYQDDKPTVVTTNLNLVEIGAAFDGRLSSRLGEGVVLELTGPDRRLLGQSESMGSGRADDDR